MARRGENIYLRKDGRYEGRYVIGKKANGGTAFGYVYGKKYSDVKRKLCVLKSEYIKEENSNLITYLDGTITAWMNYWLEHFIKPDLKPSTLANYRKITEKYIIPIIGSQKLQNVSKETLRNLYEELLAKGCSIHYAQNICRRFHCALLAAQEENYIAVVPALPFKKASALPKEPRYLSKNEQKQLEKSLNLTVPKDVAIFLGLYTGMRIGECCALKWEDINFSEHEIMISHTFQRAALPEGKHKTSLLYAMPKTEKSIRRIPMTESLESVLSQLKQTKQPEQTDFVFGNSKKPMEPRILQYYMKTLEKNTQIEGIHFHTLRHTFATRCLEMEMDAKTLSELLGHSSTKITLDCYCHSSQNRKRMLIQRLDTE